MQPKIGPVIYSVREANGLVIAGGATSARIRFRFPRAVFVTGLQLVTSDGSPATLARLSLRIQDETQQEIAFNWQGGVTAPALALGGFFGIGGPGPFLRAGSAWFALQRPVSDSDQWFFTLSATAGGAITVRNLLLRFDEGMRNAA